MDCIRLKQTERKKKISCNYNCVQLALTWLLKGPGALWFKQEELKRDSCFFCTYITLRVASLKTTRYQRKNNGAETFSLELYSKSVTRLVSVSLGWHWSLVSEQGKRMYWGAVWAPRMRWSSPKSCGVSSVLWSVILGPAPPTERSRAVTTCEHHQSSDDDRHGLSAGTRHGKGKWRVRVLYERATSFIQNYVHMKRFLN